MNCHQLSLGQHLSNKSHDSTRLKLDLQHATFSHPDLDKRVDLARLLGLALEDVDLLALLLALHAYLSIIALQLTFAVDRQNRLSLDQGLCRIFLRCLSHLLLLECLLLLQLHLLRPNHMLRCSIEACLLATDQACVC